MSSLRVSRRVAFCCAALLLLFPAAAARADSGREEFTRTFQKTSPLKAGQRLSIESRNGDIRVRTHSEPQVSIHPKTRLPPSHPPRPQKLPTEILTHSAAGADPTPP